MLCDWPTLLYSAKRSLLHWHSGRNCSFHVFAPRQQFVVATTELTMNHQWHCMITNGINSIPPRQQQAKRAPVKKSTSQNVPAKSDDRTEYRDNRMSRQESQDYKGHHSIRMTLREKHNHITALSRSAPTAIWCGDDLVITDTLLPTAEGLACWFFPRMIFFVSFYLAIGAVFSLHTKFFNSSPAFSPFRFFPNYTQTKLCSTILWEPISPEKKTLMRQEKGTFIWNLDTLACAGTTQDRRAKKPNEDRTH